MGGAATFIQMSARQQNGQVETLIATGAFAWSRYPRLGPVSCEHCIELSSRSIRAEGSGMQALGSTVESVAF